MALLNNRTSAVMPGRLPRGLTTCRWSALDAARALQNPVRERERPASKLGSFCNCSKTREVQQSVTRGILPGSLTHFTAFISWWDWR